MFKVLNGIPFVFLHNPDREYNEKLKRLALSAERRISKLPVTEGWEVYARNNQTTSRYGAYNTFLLSPLTWPLLNLIRAGYWLFIQNLNVPRAPRIIESWINIHRTGQNLHRHSHNYPFIASYAVNAEPSSTIYGTYGRSRNEEVEIKNNNGDLVITIGYPVYHEVTTWEENDPRVTIACDIAGPELNHPQRVFVPFDA